MRAGADYFVTPTEPAQRRYEALRSYVVDDATAADVAARFGYSPATVHQLAAELRAGHSEFFRSSKPGPRGPRKSTKIPRPQLARVPHPSDQPAYRVRIRGDLLHIRDVLAGTQDPREIVFLWTSRPRKVGLVELDMDGWLLPYVATSAHRG